MVSYQNHRAYLAGDEGFEPPQTESESGVLPLHKSPLCAAPKCMYYYMHLRKNVKSKIAVFAKIKLCCKAAFAASFSASSVFTVYAGREHVNKERGRKRAGNHAEYY